jgi:hypothetical protein
MGLFDKRIGIEDARRELNELKNGYEGVLVEFNSRIATNPLALMGLSGTVRELVKRENSLLEKMRVSFPDGTPEREETRKLYQEVNNAALRAEGAVKEMRK